jgi:hypothetical protein
VACKRQTTPFRMAFKDPWRDPHAIKLETKSGCYGLAMAPTAEIIWSCPLTGLLGRRSKTRGVERRDGYDSMMLCL